MNLTNLLLVIIIVLLVFIFKKQVIILTFFRKSKKNYILNKDPLFDKALKIIKNSNSASASLLQRHLEIGYARAAIIIDQLEGAGYVGPATGSIPREVYET